MTKLQPFLSSQRNDIFFPWIRFIINLPDNVVYRGTYIAIFVIGGKLLTICQLSAEKLDISSIISQIGLQLSNLYLNLCTKRYLDQSFSALMKLQYHIERLYWRCRFDWKNICFIQRRHKISCISTNSSNSQIQQILLWRGKMSNRKDKLSQL